MLNSSKRFSVIMAALLLVLLASPICLAEDNAEVSGTEQTAPAEKSDLTRGLVAIAAALAVGLSALATGLAQSRIGAAGCGTLAEKPETAGTIILLVAIPETMVILGFVIAIVLLFAV